MLPLPISPIQSSTPSDTKISHPPRTYIKFPCLQDIEKGHLFTFPRTISCEVQFLELGPPRFQETFGEPASDEVLGRELRKGVSLRGTAPRGALKRGGFWVVKAVSASRRGWLYVSPRIGFLRILGLGQIGGGGRGGVIGIYIYKSFINKTTSTYLTICFRTSKSWSDLR